MKRTNTKTTSEILTGDCLDILKDMDSSEKFDVVMGDPPYNIGKDFGNDSDSRPLKEYISWSKEWLDACFEHLAEDGLIYVYGFHNILAHVAVQYPLESQHWMAWHYTNKAVPSSKFWQRSHEAIICMWHPGKRPVLELDQIRVPYTEGYTNCAGKVRKGTSGRYSSQGALTLYADNGGALPRDVISVPALAGGAGRAERWFQCLDCGGGARPPKELSEHRDCNVMKHPTQKPAELTRQLIRSRIKDGANGSVLVPFAGSGSECVVAKSLGLRYVGIEMNPLYAEFARSWLKNV